MITWIGFLFIIITTIISATGIFKILWSIIIVKIISEKYIDDVTEYASACVELSILASQEAKLAALEVVKAEQEYEEKYGNE